METLPYHRGWLAYGRTLACGGSDSLLSLFRCWIAAVTNVSFFLTLSVCVWGAFQICLVLQGLRSGAEQTLASVATRFGSLFDCLPFWLLKNCLEQLLGSGSPSPSDARGSHQPIPDNRSIVLQQSLGATSTSWCTVLLKGLAGLVLSQLALFGAAAPLIAWGAHALHLFQ